MNWKAVVRDVLIVWILTALGGFVIGLTAGVVGRGAISPPQLQTVVGISNFLFGIVAFTIVGALAKINRFRHLLIVALWTWILSIANIFVMGITFVQWLGASIFLLIVMAIGGLTSFLFVRPPKGPDATSGDASAARNETR